jgi:hypothetical protein
MDFEDAVLIRYVVRYVHGSQVDWDVLNGRMQVVQGGVERIFGIFKVRSGIVIAVYTGSQRIFEVCHVRIINEVVKMLLGGARGLQSWIDRRLTENCKGRLDTDKGSVNLL